MRSRKSGLSDSSTTCVDAATSIIGFAVVFSTPSFRLFGLLWMSGPIYSAFFRATHLAAFHRLYAPSAPPLLGVKPCLLTVLLVVLTLFLADRLWILLVAPPFAVLAGKSWSIFAPLALILAPSLGCAARCLRPCSGFLALLAPLTQTGATTWRFAVHLASSRNAERAPLLRGRPSFFGTRDTVRLASASPFSL